MASKGLKAAVVVAALAVAAYWYWSPHLAMYQLRNAARAHDADAFNDHVDYPRLRESLKGQFSTMMAAKMGDASSTGSKASQAGAALGTMLGMALMDRMVDAMVRPEFVMKAMQDGKFGAAARDSNAAIGLASSEPDPKVSWASERKGMDKFIVYPRNEEDADRTKGVSFVFERSGFATWKLTELRVPLDK